MTLGFAVTQAAEPLVGLAFLLLLGIKLAQIRNVLLAMALINFATFPIVWFTFPALGPAPTIQAQALAVFTLLAALLYAGLLVRLRPARRSALLALLAVALPIAITVVFGAAKVANAAIAAAGMPISAAPGAGLPYRITMPASEVFAVTAEALLLALLCRPVISARQAIVLSLLANGASLAAGLAVL